MGGFGLGYEIIFNSGLGWVWVIKITTHLTQPEPPIYLKLYYIINNFLFNFSSIQLLLYKIQLVLKLLTILFLSLSPPIPSLSLHSYLFITKLGY